MAYENIKLRKSNFTIIDGYFWTFDKDIDSVIVKTDDGTTAFSYPLDTTLTQEVLSLEYDGRNLWTMRATGTNEYTIDRWYIDNYICKLRSSFIIVSSPSNTFDSDAFTIEHYHTEFSSNEAAGQSVLSILETSNMDSGYTIVLGPNNLGQMEEKTISSATTGSVQINGSTTYEYEAGDPVSFYKRIWLFNNYNGTDGSTGALYAIDAYTGSVVTKYSGGIFKDISSATFFNVPRYVFDKSVGQGVTDPEYNTICFVKGSNMLFLDPSNPNNSFGSMTMDNIKSDLATVINIYDLVIEGLNIYRLQLEATYYGQTASFQDNTYNYQLSTLNSFITSISLQADPAILPANGVNTSTVTAIVKDQFGLPVQQRQVFFTDDDPDGSILSSPVNTDANGRAQTVYVSGLTAREVKVTATAQQS